MRPIKTFVVMACTSLEKPESSPAALPMACLADDRHYELCMNDDCFGHDYSMQDSQIQEEPNLPVLTPS
jgi:hypothetical protein